MPYTRTSPILNTATPLDLDGLYEAWLDGGAGRGRDLIGYLTTVTSGAVRLGIDPVVMLAQWDLETDSGHSPWWANRLNPAGIGITGDPKQNEASQTWATGHDAALGHLAHMTAYLWQEDWVDHWPDTWPDPIDVDRRFTAPIRAGYVADELQDLNGTWAVDPQNDYGGKLATRANRIVEIAGKESEPMAVTFGNVPHSVHQRRIVENSRAWNALGERTIRGVVWHRMIGSLWGTDQYFRTEAVGRALTDYGIGVAARDGADHAGELLMWNDPRGPRSPWANGSLSSPYGDGLAFYNRWGTTGINRDLVSIEISGNYDTPLDPDARSTLVALTAYWADQYKVSWETFPTVPGEERSFVIWHQEFTIGTGKICPGQVVMGETSALIAQVKELLRNYQTSAPVPAPDPQYAKPQPVPKGTQIINDRLFLGVTETYTVKKQVTPRLWAEATSPATGPDLMTGANVTTSHVVKDVGIESDLTLVLEDGSRIPGSSLV